MYFHFLLDECRDTISSLNLIMEEMELNLDNYKELVSNIDNDDFMNYLYWHVELPPFYLPIINDNYEENEREKTRRNNNLWFINLVLREKKVKMYISKDIMENILHLIHKLNRSTYKYKDLFIVDLCKILLNNIESLSKKDLIVYTQIKDAINNADKKSQLLKFFEVKKQSKALVVDDNATVSCDEIKRKHHNFYKLWDNFGWNMKKDNKIPKLLSDTVIKFTNEGEKSIIHEKLTPFIGKFNFKTECNTTIPKWWYDIKFEIEKYYISNPSLKYKDLNCEFFSDSYKEVRMALNNMTNNPLLIFKGRISEDEKSPKFVKFLQNKMKIKDISSFNWFKDYNTFRVKKEEVTVIGTKNPVKVMGMSSFSGDEWRSCQTLSKNYTDLAKGLWSDVINDTCIVMYITNNKKVNFSGIDTEIKSEKMISRAIIRLIINNNGEFGIFLDRIYPDYRTGSAIVELVNKICKENNLFFINKDNLKGNYKTPQFKCLHLNCEGTGNDNLTYPYLDSAYVKTEYEDGEYWHRHIISN